MATARAAFKCLGLQSTKHSTLQSFPQPVRKLRLGDFTYHWWMWPSDNKDMNRSFPLPSRIHCWNDTSRQMWW